MEVKTREKEVWTILIAIIYLVIDFMGLFHNLINLIKNTKLQYLQYLKKMINHKISKKGKSKINFLLVDR